MTEDSTDAIVQELQAMAVAGQDVPTLLRRVQEMMGQTECKLVSVRCFHKAFNGGVASVKAVTGWSGFGGELSDEQVNSEVRSVLDEYRRTARPVSLRDRSTGA